MSSSICVLLHDCILDSKLRVAASSLHYHVHFQPLSFFVNQRLNMLHGPCPGSSVIVQPYTHVSCDV